MSQSAALFGRPQQQQKQQPKPLLQFKAGRMTQDADNWVRPDTRKGWVYLYQSNDGKVHFCWIDRKTYLVEENFVITPKQAEFKRVTQCATGRVYLLKLKSTNTRFFVWLQEPDEKEDTFVCSRVNHYLGTTQAPSTIDWLNGIGGLSQLSRNDLLTLFSMGVGLGSGVSSESDVSSVQANAVTVGRPSETSTTVTPAVGGLPVAATTKVTTDADKRSDSGKIQLKDLRKILTGLPESIKAAKDPHVNLNDVLNEGNLRKFLEKPEVQARLLPHLPSIDKESSPTGEMSTLATNLRSAPFKTMLKSFSETFQSGSLAPLLTLFHLGSKAEEAAARGDLIAFAEALEGGVSAESETSPNSVEKRNPDKSDKEPETDSKPGTKDSSKESPMETD